MNEFIICLGSNCTDKTERLATAALHLETQGLIAARSGVYLSEPEYSAPGPLYVNEVLVFRSELTYDDLHTALKTYESGIRHSYSGPGVCIDIDIVYAGNHCLRPTDASTHYFRTGLAKIKNLSPQFGQS